jgi:hypothetical protein
MSGTAAIVETNNGGTNNVVDFTYAEVGLDGNCIPIVIATPAGIQSLSIDYGVTTPGAITINPACVTGTTISTTGTQLITAFNGVQAQVSVISNNTNPSDGDTITVGGQTYRFKTTTVAVGDIFIGASADASLISLAKVINGVGVLAASGADAFTGTKASASVVACTTTAGAAVTSATSALTSHTLWVLARQPGTSYNAYNLGTPVGTTFAILGASAANTAGATATLGNASSILGVNPVDPRSRTLFTAAANGTVTGILAAGSFYYSSTGSTAGVGIVYDTALQAMQAGWIFPDGVNGSVVTENDNASSFRINGANGDDTITNYQAYVLGLHKSDQQIQQASTAAALLSACKTWAIQKARRGEAREWVNTGYFPPTTFGF